MLVKPAFGNFLRRYSWFTAENIVEVIEVWEGYANVPAFVIVILDPFIIIFQILDLCFALLCSTNTVKILLCKQLI